jgi:hypothetical protein
MRSRSVKVTSNDDSPASHSKNGSRIAVFSMDELQHSHCTFRAFWGKVLFEGFADAEAPDDV